VHAVNADQQYSLDDIVLVYRLGLVGGGQIQRGVATATANKDASRDFINVPPVVSNKPKL